MLADIARGGDHVFQIGGAVLIRRGADGDELHGAEIDRLLDIGRESQAASSNILAHHGLQTRLIDGDAALIEDTYFVRIQVQAKHVVADICQTGAGNKSDIAGTDYCNFQSNLTIKQPQRHRGMTNENPRGTEDFTEKLFSMPLCLCGLRFFMALNQTLPSASADTSPTRRRQDSASRTGAP